MNNRTIALFIITLFAFCWSCSSKKELAAKTIQGEEPRQTSFWYYDPNFHLNSNDTYLRTDGIYFRIVDTDAFGDTYKTFRFYNNGLVISHVAYSTPEKLLTLDKTTQGNIHGYYKVGNDSLHFTTKVYYNHSPTFYSGLVYPDSIQLYSLNYKTRESDSHVFYFYKEK